MSALPDPQIGQLLAFADELADAARAVIVPLFRTALDVQAKSSARASLDPVTEADKGAERAVRALIAERYPDHAILGEEYGLTPGRGPFTWVLDPVDGTRQFIAGLPLWGTLIALVYEGRPLIGVIDQGYIGERFRGWPGGADFRRDRDRPRPIQARACARLADAVMSTTDPHLFGPEEAIGFNRLRQTTKLTRYGCDCYAYAMLAMGHLDLVVESGLAPWDVAALIAVVQGAGGAATTWRGAAIGDGDFYRSSAARTQFLASGDARLHERALEPLQSGAR